MKLSGSRGGSKVAARPAGTGREAFADEKNE